MIIPHWYRLDYLTQYEVDRPQKSWDANNMVRAIKGRGIGGYVRVRFKGEKDNYFDASNADRLAELVLRSIGRQNLPLVIDQQSAVVPIPNHNMTPTSGTDHPIINSSKILVDGYQEVKGGLHALNISACLRWTEAREKSSSKSGYRSPEQYEGLLCHLDPLPTDPVILFDDVYTSGSQAKAAARYLHEKGVTILGVLTVAKTTHEPQENSMQWRREDCEVISELDWPF